LFCRPARPRHRRPTRRLPPPEPRRRAVGSPIGTAMLSYTEHGKFRNPIQAPDPFLRSPPARREEEGRTGATRAAGHRDFCERSAFQLDHGMAFGAMGDDGAIAAIRASFAA
jgi:hypothetical protein